MGESNVEIQSIRQTHILPSGKVRIANFNKSDLSEREKYGAGCGWESDEDYGNFSSFDESNYIIAPGVQKREVTASIATV